MIRHAQLPLAIATLLFSVAIAPLSLSIAQETKVTLTHRKALLGVTNPVIKGTRIFVGEDSNPSLADAMELAFPQGYKIEHIRAKRDGVKYQAEKQEDGSLLFTGKGKYHVEVLLLDLEKPTVDEELVFEIGGEPTPIPPDPVPPDPIPPDPVPPEPQPSNLPEDEWNNVARRLDAACAGLAQSRRDQLAAAFLDAHVSMEDMTMLQGDEVRAKLATATAGFETEFKAAFKVIRDTQRDFDFSFDEQGRFYGAIADGIAGKVVSQ